MDPTRIVAHGGYELVRIPGGTFRMGPPEDGYGRRLDVPVRTVQVAEFAIGRAPVTNEEYARFLAEVPDVPRPEFWEEAGVDDPGQPVIGVRWQDARRYCEWAGLRLPTEAEWEYACRAGSTTDFATGDDPEDLDRIGWYQGNSDLRLHAVALKEANAFGLHDMHGNVWEWCEDDWDAEFRGVRNGDASARVFSPRRATHVVRGGGYRSAASYCRSASRSGRNAERVGLLGFRAALS